MTVKQYYEKLYDQCGKVMEKTFEGDNEAKITLVSGYVADFEKWISELNNVTDTNILKTSVREYQYALLALTLGQYRQANYGLRLALELVVAAVCFSTNELHYRQWLSGGRDIVWGALIDKENGVLSKNFVKAFWADLDDEVPHYRVLAETTYRELSEYVHANAHTNSLVPDEVRFEQKAFDEWCNHADTVRLIFMFVLMARYICDLEKESINRLEEMLMPDFSHVECVREFFGAVTGA